VLGTLRAVENRARLSLECYRYTQDPYWLGCAFDDCEKGGLSWNSLCRAELGVIMPPPKPAAPEAPRRARPPADRRQ
jgi:hypothetical protein